MTPLYGYDEDARLELYHSTQEAAKGFDDDWEFNPTLTSEELNQLYLELLNPPRRNYPSPPISAFSLSPPTTPSHASKAIPIVDPVTRTSVPTPQPTPKPLAYYNSYQPYHYPSSTQRTPPGGHHTNAIAIVDPVTGATLNPTPATPKSCHSSSYYYSPKLTPASTNYYNSPRSPYSPPAHTNSVSLYSWYAPSPVLSKVK
jgi:hypothetical protein